MFRVYIAGPDVFRLDWPEHCRKVSDECEKLGLAPVFPIPPAESLNRKGVPGISIRGNHEGALEVFQNCLELLASCDAVIANLQRFRGEEPDSGTVFEVATAYSYGMPTVGYFPAGSLQSTASVSEWLGTGAGLCRDRYLVENFGYPCNLMVANACDALVYGEIDKALEKIQEILNRRGD